ncbi:hypothetical protein QFC21_002155 [Naganishia friedmannii]|uniref:Uncharacterized protein n=1 Tax=Naganishia friedmannii TaxID=89922 RepID=A0ACC2W1Y5_9TREE|nr:hypothetical protein QFC21_002155 [Naganishia friedmannii]
MDLIASHLLQLDIANPELPPSALQSTPSNPTPLRHAANVVGIPSTTSGPLPPFSSISNLSSTCRQVRSNLFTSREWRSVIVKYDGISHERAERISELLMATVNDSAPLTRSNKRLPGIGDILSPYHALHHLEIDWNLLSGTDTRIQAMESAALALPAIKYDLRYSRACVLALLETLHVRLSSPKNIFIDSVVGAGSMAQQFDLILQQFDMPVLRHLEISQKFAGMLDMVKRQWVQLLKSVPADDWPNLESVRVCVDVPYRFYIDAEAEAGNAIWEPLWKAIITHFSQTKKPSPKITIILQFSFCANLTPDPFTADDDATINGGTHHYTPREQIAPPSRETMQALIDELQGPTRGVPPFTLEIRGACAPDNTDFHPFVKAVYTPLKDDGNAQTPAAAAAAPGLRAIATPASTSTLTEAKSTLEFETYQANIDRVHAATVRPRPEGEAPAAGAGAGAGAGMGGGMGMGVEMARAMEARIDALRRRGAAAAVVFGARGVFMM